MYYNELVSRRNNIPSLSCAVWNARCDMCMFSTTDHNTLRRHRMRHTGQKAYQCSFCPYTCIQAASIKMHNRAKHRGVQLSSATNDTSGGTFVYACDSCRYQTVNQRSFVSHMTIHESAAPRAEYQTQADDVQSVGTGRSDGVLTTLSCHDIGVVLEPNTQSSLLTTQVSHDCTDHSSSKIWAAVPIVW